MTSVLAQSNSDHRDILPESAISHKGCDHATAKNAIAHYPDDLQAKIPYPIQKHHRPIRQVVEGAAPTSRAAGPYNVVGYTESIHSTYIKFNENAGGIDGYVYGIGTAPGEADIRWWQAMNPTRKQTYSHSMAELGLNEGDVFYYTIYANYNNNTSSPEAYSGAMSFQWQDLGDQSNNMYVDFATEGLDENGNVIAGWAGWEIAEFNQFLNNMLPIIKDVYGPPSRNMTVTLVRNLAYSNTNVYFQGDNEIHMDNGLNPQLLTHELLHAWHDNVIFAVDDLWSYDPTLSGFEESFAQGASYACMQRYYDMYPNDPLVQGSPNCGSTMDWDYDFHNRPVLTTTDFWSAANGTGIAWERYEVGAAAVRKAWIEDNDFFSDYNNAYYAAMNSDHSLVPSRAMARGTFATVHPTCEGTPTGDWIDQQRIFDCEVVTGFKVYDNFQNYPSWENHWIFQDLYYYETFSNGSEWAIYDSQSETWTQYASNGSSGTATLWDYGNNVDYSGNITITPYDNPPVLLDIGEQFLNLTTSSTQNPWPGGPSNEFIFDVDDFGLYEMEVNFPNASGSFPRVIGTDLIDFKGVYGGVLNDNGGEIFLEHEDHSSSPSTQLINGAFYADKDWVGVPNAITQYEDSDPGRVGAMYIDDDCNKFVDFRTIDWGSSSGNQALLFDPQQMDPVVETADFEFTLDVVTANFNNLSETYSHPDFTFDEGPVSYEWDFGDQATSTEMSPSHTYPGPGQYNACLTVTHGCWSETTCEMVNIDLVGISQIDEVTISTYPNPASEFIVVELDRTVDNSVVEILNNLGQTVKSTAVNGTRVQLDVSILAAGEYTIVLSSKEQEIQSKQIIITK